MIVKKTGGCIIGADLTAAEKKALHMEIHRQVAEFDRENQVNVHQRREHNSGDDDRQAEGGNMKKAIAIILCAVMAMSLCGCYGRTKRDFGDEVPHCMSIVDVTNGYTIYRHDETGVCYFCRDAGYGKSVCVMLNPDGTPYVWEVHNGE